MRARAVVHERLRVRPVHAARRRVARVADRDLAGSAGSCCSLKTWARAPCRAAPSAGRPPRRRCPADSWPRCWSAKSAKYESRATSRSTERMPKTPHISRRLPCGPELVERDAEDRVAADLADPPDADVASRAGRSRPGRPAARGSPGRSPRRRASADRRRGRARRRRPSAERRLGERDGEAAVGDVVRRASMPARRDGACADERHLAPRGRASASRPRRSRAGLQLRAGERTRERGRGEQDRVALPPAAAARGARRARARRSRRRASGGSSGRRCRCRARRCRRRSAAERLARLRHPLDRLGELPADLGLLGVAEVEAVGEAERLAAGAGDVARRLEDRGCAAGERDRASRCGPCRRA